MTINQLRQKYPHADFYFFKNGLGMSRAPFLHDTIKSYTVGSRGAIFIEM